MRWRARTIVLRQLCWRASRPQPKHDPLAATGRAQMTGPTPQTTGQATRKGRLLWPLLVIGIVGIIYGWLVARPPSEGERRAAIEQCRTRYAVARTHGDSVLVDALPLPRRRWQPHAVCLDYRLRGMR